MVFGIGNPSGGAAGPGVSAPQMEMALAEMDMITDVFNRLVGSCHNKCISTRYAEPDLNKGESVCVDRCVAKFFEVNKKVGERMSQMGAAGASGGGGATGSSFGGF